MLYSDFQLKDNNPERELHFTNRQAGEVNGPNSIPRVTYVQRQQRESQSQHKRLNKSISPQFFYRFNIPDSQFTRLGNILFETRLYSINNSCLLVYVGCCLENSATLLFCITFFTKEFCLLCILVNQIKVYNNIRNLILLHFETN